MFNVTIINHGYWTEAEYATSLGMNLTANGNWRGWISREEIDALQRAGIDIIVW